MQALKSTQAFDPTLDLDIEVLEPLDAHVAPLDGPGQQAWQQGWSGVAHTGQAVYAGTQGNWGDAVSHGAHAVSDFGQAAYNTYQWYNGGH
ncbi:hypothetical protein [Streptomyces sp. NRRL S-920]|uniref:hypothetical protein n=1 Tax=Streptomyces sp. NRRL S-920 TaxID=1463921 RepID=UPI0004CB2FC7|nr:hypothetical protein [Streptomyces sp. NRRL S-920]